MELFITPRKLEPWPYSSPPTIEPFEFERILNAPKWRKWMASNWPLSVVVSCVYLMLIFFGQKFMKNRKPFDLKPAMVVWNLTLAIFSTFGFIRTSPELYQVLVGPNGLHRSVCVRDILNESSIFWAWLFTWSKLIELGDTFFILLRKKDLTFLHWYHHLTVLLVCWISFPDYEPVFRIFGVVNFLIHAIMYFYFALKIMRVPVPRLISMLITTMQMSQMVIGIGVNLYALYVKSSGEPCARSDGGILMYMFLYGTYLLLFANYFYQAYIVKKSPKKTN